eukprot:scaffold25526_cov21-Tisochrysis_lutea.AAC.1
MLLPPLLCWWPDPGALNAPVPCAAGAGGQTPQLSPQQILLGLLKDMAANVSYDCDPRQHPRCKQLNRVSAVTDDVFWEGEGSTKRNSVRQICTDHLHDAAELLSGSVTALRRS